MADVFFYLKNIIHTFEFPKNLPRFDYENTFLEHWKKQ